MGTEKCAVQHCATVVHPCVCRKTKKIIFQDAETVWLPRAHVFVDARMLGSLTRPQTHLLCPCQQVSQLTWGWGILKCGERTRGGLPHPSSGTYLPPNLYSVIITGLSECKMTLLPKHSGLCLVLS